MDEDAVKSFLEQLKDFDHEILYYTERNLMSSRRFEGDLPSNTKIFVALLLANRPTIQNSDPLEGIDIYGVKHFTYDQLKEWTENFNRKNMFDLSQYGRLFPLNTQEHRGAFLKTWDLFFPNCPRYKLHPARLHNELVTLSNESIIHKNLPKLIGYSCDQILAVVYSDLRPKINMFDAIQSEDFSWKDRIKAAFQLADLIHFMYSKGIIVGSIAKGNLLIDENGDIKLLSIGLSVRGGYKQAEGIADYVYGSYGCSAPEISSGVVTVKTDTYAYGVLLLELISKELANRFNPQSDVEYFLKRQQGGQSSFVHASFQVDDTTGSKITNLAFSCVAGDPELRVEMSEVMKCLLEICNDPAHDLPTPGSKSEWEEEKDEEENERKKQKFEKPKQIVT